MTEQSIPTNVTVRKFTQYDLRRLFADSRFLVMPLEAVNFQACITAMLEALLMSKAVCSRIPGQTHVIVEGENGRYMTSGDASALRAEIARLLAEPEEAERWRERPPPGRTRDESRSLGRALGGNR